MREPISLKDIFAIIIKRGRMIICLMVVFALLLGGYSALRGQSAATGGSLAYQEQLDSYHETKAHLEEDLEDAKTQCEQTKKYNENSIVMGLKPYDLYKSVSVYLITVTDADVSKSASGAMEDLAYIASVIQQCYQLYWETTDLGVAMGIDLENRYLQEVIQLEGTESGALVLTVYSNTKEDAEALADSANNCLLNMRDAVLAKTYGHEISKFNQIVEHSTNSLFATHQKEQRKQLTEQKDAVKDLEKQLGALTPPMQTNTSVSLAGIAKWAILGAFAGLALGCVWALVAFVMFAKTESSQQMEAALGIPYLGTTAKARDPFQRLAGKIMGETQWKDREHAAAFVAENLRALGAKEDLAIITTLHSKDACAALEQAAQTLQPVCINIRYAANAQANRDAVEILGNCKYLLLAERIGASDVPKMQALLSAANRLGVTVLGFITI